MPPASAPSPRTPDPRPLVIAHRGASGYLPEHSLPAKALAHDQGADYLEQDVVATRDGGLIVFHDLHLDDLTDVASRFPGRARPDGLHYCVDFDLAEIQQLRLTERRKRGTGVARYPGRFPAETGDFTIPSLAGEFRFIQDLNQGTGRRVGVYIEVKDPAWHRGQGIDLAASVLRVLDRFGYRGPGDGAFLQCFDGGELRRIRAELGSRLPLVQLLDRSSPVPGAAALKELARTVQVLGVSLGLLYEMQGGPQGGVPVPTGLAAAARAAGLGVHAFTLREDDLPAGFESTAALVDFLVRQCHVEGLFTDFPDLVVRALEAPARA